jgi:putative sugar O-methyltransferase
MTAPDPLLTKAKLGLARARATRGPAALEPSEHWRGVLNRFHERAFATCDTPDALISFATENNGFVVYRLNTDPTHATVADGYLSWLEEFGRPLQSFDESICETSKVSPKVVMTRGGRRVSTSFLWHLCIAAQLQHALADPPGTVLEIGPGFGGLARLLKMLWPKTRFTLVDLPESLVFTQVYLESAHPDAKTVFAASPEELRTVDDDCDFLLVPSSCLHDLGGKTFDLALNIAAFGEMKKDAVGSYMNFIEREADVRWFYGINLFGQHPPESGRVSQRLHGDDICRVAMPLDPHWRTLLWDMHGEAGFAQVDPLMAPCLEILMERIPAPQRAATEREREARDCFAKAQARESKDSAWCRLMWDAVRLSPEQADIVDAWNTHGRALNWPEVG